MWKATGIAATTGDFDRLFERWDVDNSGTIDYNELNKALKRGMARLRDDLTVDGDTSVDDINLLGGKNRAAVKQAKEWKEEARRSRIPTLDLRRAPRGLASMPAC